MVQKQGKCGRKRKNIPLMDRRMIVMSLQDRSSFQKISKLLATEGVVCPQNNCKQTATRSWTENISTLLKINANRKIKKQ